MVDELIQQVVDWVSLAGPLGVYLIFTLIAYLENVVPPLPGDVLVAFSGYLAAEGLIGLFPIWGLTVLASVFGFMNMYWIGNKLESQITANRHDHILLRFINYDYIRIGQRWMNKYGQWVVVANRFLAGTRSVISLTAGMAHLNLWKTVLNSLISSMLWNGILIGAGWVIKENWQVIGSYLSAYGKVILIGISIFIGVVYFVRFKSKNKRAKKNSSE
jgi:membrane protein DedA with SNARE-associated domain